MERILGIDAGAVSVAVAVVDGDGQLVGSACRAHGGKPVRALDQCLKEIGVGEGIERVATGSLAGSLGVERKEHELVAAITAARKLHPGLGGLLIVGGERFSLSLFDAKGDYLYSRYNSLCAAGTGSFLDQQARRLGLSGSAELAARALENQGPRPQIASRCAVFAKTDLIHAQQEGHSIEAICDGLCHGLAANIADTLFTHGLPRQPVVFAGGVALNEATRRYLEKMTGLSLVVDGQPDLYAAYGAALMVLERGAKDGKRTVYYAKSRQAGADKALYEPLRPTRGSYPDFSAHHSYIFRPSHVSIPAPVEVDDYRDLAGDEVAVVLGIDIGSTSTKAVLLALDETSTGGDPPVLAGFYTRTAGRPLEAVQGILEAASDWARRKGGRIDVRGLATTGSGRKFIGAVAGADLVLDEITAHARAAVELDPAVDTIIEIGGQDAKFTSLSGGRVTQAIMNYVCAAGTGSFIEEQAARLGCRLEDMEKRVMGRASPVASDRCTVFMERDLNQFLADGYHPDEVLCAVLHAVRDNYLMKVARGGVIGKRVCFQGATAKNRALVAAFEQRLGIPIQVSRYCHLTGALGAALELRTQLRKGEGTPSRFRGLDLYSKKIPVRSEVCQYCQNHCKLQIAEVDGEVVGFGYLCGRDPGEKHYVRPKGGFDLLRERRRCFQLDVEPPQSGPVVGIPDALHLAEDLPLWRKFFALLGVRTITSTALTRPVGRGKRLAGAEFCAPIAAWHAHVAYLAEKADFVFTPFYLEDEHPAGERRQWCYYTQYAPALASHAALNGVESKLLRPLLHIGARKFESFDRLQKALEPVLGKIPRSRIETAYRQASEWNESRMQQWRQKFERAVSDGGDIAVVLLGRPYTVLSERMNAGIPEILARHGVRAFYHDMLEPLGQTEPGLESLRRQTKWRNARRIFEAAWRVCKTPGVYPILLTSFKCTPDACTMEHFRRIMESFGKPYLILQLDEHDSRVGYETRIEAALRTFRNHFASGSDGRNRMERLPRPLPSRGDPARIVFVPHWDTLATPLFVAGLQEVGVDARLLRETPGLIRTSLGDNTGQCLPLSIILHEFVEQVKAERLDPAQCSLWMPSSSIACNICFFLQYGRAMLERVGGGFERAGLYPGEITCHEISPKATLNAFYAFYFGGMLRRMQCRIRPYEKHRGQTDEVVEWGLELLRQAMLGAVSKPKAVKKVVDAFLQIEREDDQRPIVAIFGDLYARDNDVFNQDLIRLIEAHGGEALTTPYSEYVRIIAKPYLRKWLREGNYKDVLMSAPFAYSMDLLEYPFRREFERVLGRRKVVKRMGRPEELLGRFGVSMYHTGESFDNLLKIFHLLERYPEIALFVQTSPAFCCPSLVTEAMASRIEKETGRPVVTVNYDGTSAEHNRVVIPYLELAVRRAQG